MLICSLSDIQTYTIAMSALITLSMNYMTNNWIIKTTHKTTHSMSQAFDQIPRLSPCFFAGEEPGYEAIPARPHQLHWGDQGMVTVISCTEWH